MWFVVCSLLCSSEASSVVCMIILKLIFACILNICFFLLYGFNHKVILILDFYFHKPQNTIRRAKHVTVIFIYFHFLEIHLSNITFKSLCFLIFKSQVIIVSTGEVRGFCHFLFSTLISEHAQNLRRSAFGGPAPGFEVVASIYDHNYLWYFFLTL